MYKYTPIYSDGAEPELKENDVFRVTIPLNAQDIVSNAQGTERNVQVNRVKVTEKAIIEFCDTPKSLKEIIDYFGYKNVRGFREKYINILLKENKLSQTLPDKLRSRNQKYISAKL